ncbi:lysis protein [Pantoea ananatis]|uniref:lysis protein n=1 Tax=Pantoea ananas TaxID=553 RepID=UPI0023B0C212|nr:lysis protein [Pantoea ananatis]
MMWLKANVSLVMAILLVVLIAGLVLATSHYRNSSVKFKEQRDGWKTQAEQQQETINDMQRRQRSVAALDAKYTKELNDAKATINQLKLDVDSGKRRLQLNATCKPATTGTTSSTSMADAAIPRLTDSAQRDYFTLRDRIETAGKQIAGLQSYIREQCLP